MDGHDEVVRREFRPEAATFTETGWTSSGLERIVEMVGPDRGEQVLDVAAGAGGMWVGRWPRAWPA